VYINSMLAALNVRAQLRDTMGGVELSLSEPSFSSGRLVHVPSI
jgi:hypothetical protein